MGLRKVKRNGPPDPSTPRPRTVFPGDATRPGADESSTLPGGVSLPSSELGHTRVDESGHVLIEDETRPAVPVGVGPARSKRGRPAEGSTGSTPLDRVSRGGHGRDESATAPDTSGGADVETIPMDVDAAEPAEDEGGVTKRGMGRTLALGTMWQVISQFAPLAIGLLMTPFIIDGLGRPRYSIYLLINGLTLVFGQFDGGIGQSALRFFTVNAAAGDRHTNTRLLTTLTVLSTGLMVLIFGTLTLNAGAVLDFFKVQPPYRPEATFLLVVMMVGTGAIVVRNLFNSVLFAHHRFVTTAIATVAGQVVYAGGLLWTVWGDHGLYGIAYTFMVQQAVGTVITLPVSFQYLDRHGVGFLSKAEIKEFFGYAWKVQFAGLVAMLMQQKDQLAAGRILGGQASGPYSQGTTFSTQLRMMPLNALGPMQAMIGHLVGESGMEAAKARVEEIQRFWVRAVTGWYAVGIPAAYVGVRRWLPDSFSMTGTVAALLLLGYLFASWSVVLMLWSLILGHSELDARYGSVALVANIVLSAVAWFPFGIMGVVTCTAISWFIAVVWFKWDADRTLPLTLRSFWGDIPLLAATAGYGLTFTLELFAEPFLPRHVVGLFSAGLVALPGLALYAFLAFSPAQLRQGVAMARARVGR